MMRLRIRTHSKRSPHLRRGFFIALTFFSTFPTLIQAWEPSANRHLLHGQTVDEHGQVIPYVSLISKNTGVFVLSDENGQFSYSSPLADDDSVMVQRIGYQNQVLPIENIFQSQAVQLTADMVHLDAVEVQARKIARDNSITVLGEHTRSRGSVAADHKQLLARIPGISIKTYGGPAGISTLSMDGGPSSHTMVLVNGIDISSAQNGEADLSQLPLPYIESMSYLPYDISQSRSGGVDGVVKLESGYQQDRLNISQGSFGHRAYDVYLTKQIAEFWATLQVGQRQETGNYPVLWDETWSHRKNNHFTQDFVAVSLRKLISKNIYWQANMMHSDQERGVAGLLWSPDTVSHREDQLRLFGTTLGWIRTHGASHLKIASRYSLETYNNPTLNIASDHQVAGYQITLEDQSQLGQRAEIHSNLHVNLDKIHSASTGDHSRYSLSGMVAPTLKLMRNIHFTPALKLHYSPDLFKQYLNDLMIYIPLRWGPLSSIAASWGEVFKYPSFNDQYWEPGGNPHLEAEETQVTTIQSRIDLLALGSLHLQWQKKESTNLIQWMPVLSYWQPGNVQSATRESSKLLWQVELPVHSLAAYANYSSIHSRDLSMQRPLRYAPQRTAAAGFSWTPEEFEFNLQYHYVSRRISMYSYPEDVTIPATGLFNGSISHTWLTKPGDLTLVLSAENIAGLQYETIKGYPEPGRSYRLTLRISR